MATSSTDAVLAALRQITGTAALVEAQLGMQTQMQGDAFFQLAYAKQSRMNHLRLALGCQKIRTVWVTNNIRMLSDAALAGKVRALEKDFFSTEDPMSVEKKCADLNRSVVVVNNNDAHEAGSSDRLARWVARCPDTVFLAWDWDNHHWLSLSYPLAALVDVYCPAHYENLYPLSRFNAAIAVVPCGTVQWTVAFMRARQELMLNAVRVAGPLGKHIYYGAFGYRNQVIATLEPRYPHVRFTNHQFHDLTPEEKFLEWVGFKLHMIVPVLNDVPIRLFDAWVTGGIPLAPESLRFSTVFADVDARDVVYYSAADMLEPQAMIRNALELFDTGGREGMLRRHNYGLLRHHGEQRLRRMLEVARDLIGFTGP
jgi:hypothetical protein